MKKYDPLWEIVGEKISLQGVDPARSLLCPECHVTVDLPKSAQAGARFHCGLCGALCEVAALGLVADDGPAQIGARLAQ
jgi:hypothetical protein